MNKLIEKLQKLSAKKIPIENHWNHWLALLFYSEISLSFLTNERPLISADYFFYVNRLISNRFFFLKNGFFHLPYYSPAFGGGCANYGDPQDMTFSFLQFFFNIMPDVFTAFLATFFISSILCYLGTYLFLRRFDINKWIATTAALSFSMNGFITARWLIGHVTTSHIYWALPWTLLTVFDLMLQKDWKGVFLHSLILGFFIGVIVYGGGIVVLNLSFLLSCTMLVAMFVTTRKKPSKMFAVGCAVSLACCFFLTSSKWVAMFDLLKQFPRYMMNYRLNMKQLLWLLPNAYFNPFLRIETALPYEIGGAHEFCNYVGVTTLLLLAVWLAIKIFKNAPVESSQSQRTLTFFLAWLAITAPISFYLSKGWNIGWLFMKNLPILSTNQGTIRFLGAVPFVLMGFTAAYLSHLLKKDSKKPLVIFLGILFFMDLFSYNVLTIKTVKLKKENIDAFMGPSLISHAGGIAIGKWTVEGTSDALLNGEGNAEMINSLYAYGIVKTKIDLSKPPLFRFPDGTFNINDPVSMIYPQKTGRPPWSRLPVTVGEESARRFLSFEDPGFYIPFRQKLANVVSILTLLFMASAIPILSLKKWALRSPRS